MTVESRTKTGVFVPGWKTFAIVRLEMSELGTNSPNAPVPRACTTRSGMRSRSKRWSFSIRCESCRTTGPSGPAVCEFSLSPTGDPLSRVISTAYANCSDAMPITAMAVVLKTVFFTFICTPVLFWGITKELNISRVESYSQRLSVYLSLAACCTGYAVDTWEIFVQYPAYRASHFRYLQRNLALAIDGAKRVRRKFFGRCVPSVWAMR